MRIKELNEEEFFSLCEAGTFVSQLDLGTATVAEFNHEDGPVVMISTTAGKYGMIDAVFA